MNFKKIIYYIPRILAAIILIQTLYYKFTGHPDSMYIFSKMGMEPWGRIAMGVIELICGIMLVIPVVAWLGAGITAGLMAGAIFSHLGPLGVEVQGDGGTLFILAVVTFICSLIVLYQEKDKVINAFKYVKGQAL